MDLKTLGDRENVGIESFLFFSWQALDLGVNISRCERVSEGPAEFVEAS